MASKKGEALDLKEKMTKPFSIFLELLGIFLSALAAWKWKGVAYAAIGVFCFMIVVSVYYYSIYLYAKYLKAEQLENQIKKLDKESYQKDMIIRELETNLKTKDDSIRLFEEKMGKMCNFCRQLENGDRLMIEGKHEEAMHTYESALKRIPGNLRGPQRLAMLDFISEKHGRISKPFDLFRQSALKYFTQFSVQRALYYLHSSTPDAYGLHNLSELIYLLKIVGNPQLFSLITDSKEETSAFSKAMKLHHTSRDEFKKQKDHFIKLLNRYCDILLNPGLIDLNKDPKDDIDNELVSTCKGCPLNLRCLYTFSDIVLHALTLRKADAKTNVTADELLEINKHFAPKFLQIFETYKIVDNEKRIVGWPSVVVPNLKDIADKPVNNLEVDPYVTAFILRYFSTNSGFGLQSIRKKDIISCLRKLDSMQIKDTNANEFIVKGSEYNEPNITINLCGSWETRYFGIKCHSSLLTIEMAEQLHLLLDDYSEFGPTFQEILTQVKHFTLNNLEAKIGSYGEETPYIVDYAAHSDYYKKFKYSDITATAAAIRFLLLQHDSIDIPSILKSVEWLIKQQNPIGGEWPVISLNTLTSNRKSCGYDEEFKNVSLFNTISSIETLLAWVDFVKTSCDVQHSTSDKLVLEKKNV